MPSLYGTYGQPTKLKKKKKPKLTSAPQVTLATTTTEPKRRAARSSVRSTQAQKPSADSIAAKRTRERRVIRERRITKRLKKAASKGGSVSHPSLGPRQETFTKVLAKRTGLSPSVLAGMVANEQPNDNPAIEGSDNWLNIGHYTAGPGDAAYDKRFFQGPRKAAKSTAKFFKGKLPGIEPLARIPEIIHTAGKSDQEQIKAIQNSGWADSGHQALPALAPKTVVKKGKPVPTPLKRKATKVLGKKKTREIIQGPKQLTPKQTVLGNIPREFRAEGRNDSRTPEVNAATDGASPTSDHLTTWGKDAFAADLPFDEQLAIDIAKKAGLDSHTGTNTRVDENGLRHLLIYKDKGHWDHIHYSVRDTGAAQSASSSSGGGSPSPTIGALTGGAKPKLKPKERRKLYSDSGYYKLDSKPVTRDEEMELELEALAAELGVTLS